MQGFASHGTHQHILILSQTVHTDSQAQTASSTNVDPMLIYTIVPLLSLLLRTCQGLLINKSTEVNARWRDGQTEEVSPIPPAAFAVYRVLERRHIVFPEQAHVTVGQRSVIVYEASCSSIPTQQR